MSSLRNSSPINDALSEHQWQLLAVGDNLFSNICLDAKSSDLPFCVLSVKLRHRHTLSPDIFQNTGQEQLSSVPHWAEGELNSPVFHQLYLFLYERLSLLVYTQQPCCNLLWVYGLKLWLFPDAPPAQGGTPLHGGWKHPGARIFSARNHEAKVDLAMFDIEVWWTFLVKMMMFCCRGGGYNHPPARGAWTQQGSSANPPCALWFLGQPSCKEVPPIPVLLCASGHCWHISIIDFLCIWQWNIHMAALSKGAMTGLLQQWQDSCSGHYTGRFVLPSVSPQARSKVPPLLLGFLRDVLTVRQSQGWGKTNCLGLHKPQVSGSDELQHCDHSWQNPALGRTRLPRDGDPVRQVELGLLGLPSLRRIEGVLSLCELKGSPT